MNFENILEDVGDFGPYQKRLIWRFMVPPTFATALYIMNVVFMVSVPNHWCFVPELMNTNLTMDQQKLLSIPRVTLNGEERFSKCQMYSIDYSQLLRNISEDGWQIPIPAEEWPVQSCSSGWIYDESLYGTTLASQWDLVCDRQSLPSLVLTLCNLGSMIGTFLFGYIADNQGRRTAFFINIAVALTFGVLAEFSPTFIAFLVVRMIAGTTCPANFQLPYIIAVEQVGSKLRSRLICLSWMLWTLGCCLLPLVAYLCGNWITLGLVTTLPIMLFFGYWNSLPQTPRFLLSQGKYEEAATVFELIAKQNGKDVPKDLVPKLKKICDNMEDEEEVEEHSFLDLFRYPGLRKKFFVITINWCSIAVAYYGLTINVSNLGGNDYLNFFLVSVIELPAFPVGLYMMERVGRRWSNFCFVSLAGISCLLPVFLPPEMTLVGIVASLIGKFGSAAAFMVVYQQAAELYPTCVRSLGMSIGSTITSLAIISMPYVIYIGLTYKAFPFLVMGGLCIIAGLVAPLVPETLNQSLPQTIQDSEMFGKDQSFFNCFRKTEETEAKEEVKKEVNEQLPPV